MPSTQVVPVLGELVRQPLVPLVLGALLGWFLKMLDTSRQERRELRAGVALLLADLDRMRQRLRAPDFQDLPRQLPSFEVMLHRGPLARLPISVVKGLLELNGTLEDLAALTRTGAAGSAAEARLYWNDTGARRALLRDQAVAQIEGLEQSLARGRWLGFRHARQVRRELAAGSPPGGGRRE